MSGLTGLVWVFSAVLAVVFLVAGVNRVFRYQKSRDLFPWEKDLPRALVQLIGILEILGAVGLILPVATGIYPALTVAAAIGLSLLMFMAATFHTIRRERDLAAVNLLILLLTLMVIYGRRALLPL